MSQPSVLTECPFCFGASQEQTSDGMIAQICLLLGYIYIYIFQPLALLCNRFPYVFLWLSDDVLHFPVISYGFLTVPFGYKLLGNEAKG